VLLRNRDGALPLSKGLQRIVVIGSHADKGVLSGGGSSQVIPVGGIAVPGLGPRDFPGPLVYDPSSPVKSIADEAGGARVDYDDGDVISRAVETAKGADAIIIFARQWTAEMLDAPDLSLPDRQESLIKAVAAVNPRTVVVLETGGPVRMPWLPLTAAVIEAWYPGARGGEAIARALFGDVNPSGRLPITFPVDESRLPRVKLIHESRSKAPGAQSVDVNYSEGALVGYKWFARNGAKTLFPFGYGLSYTTFDHTGLTASASGSGVTISVAVKNTGPRPGADVLQVYARRVDDADFPIRLVGWSKVLLEPGEMRRVSLKADLRLFARFDAMRGSWEIAPGRYAVEAGANAAELPLKTELTLAAVRLKPDRRKLQ